MQACDSKINGALAYNAGLVGILLGILDYLTTLTLTYYLLPPNRFLCPQNMLFGVKIIIVCVILRVIYPILKTSSATLLAIFDFINDIDTDMLFYCHK